METLTIFDFTNRIFLFIVLVVAGITKAFDIQSISKPLQELGISKKSIATLTGFLLLCIEIAAGIALIIPKVVLIGSFTAILLFSTFFVLGLLIARMKKLVNCGCFGAMSNEQIGNKTAEWSACC